MRCNDNVTVNQQDLADAKGEEVVAPKGLAKAQLRAAKARQELSDGIQNGVLKNVRTSLVEEALMTTVIRDNKPASEDTRVLKLKQKPMPLAIEEIATPEHVPRE